MPGSLIDMDTNANNGFNPHELDPDELLECQNSFPLLSLAPEIISSIISHFNQLQVLNLRLVCRQLRNLIDELYGFRFNIYDEAERLNGIRKFKCEKITVWKLIVPMESHLFDYPSFLKTIEISGPITPANLQLLIGPCVNLEKFSIVRRANYPWVLNLRDTPALGDLKKLKYLLLNCEESKGCRFGLVTLPLMDCYFPLLTNFEIVKGFHMRQYSSYVGSVLRFIGRHHQSLTVLGLCMLPRRNLCFFPPDNSDVELNDQPGAQSRQHQVNHRLDRHEVNVDEFCKVNVKTLSITTQGYKEDIKIWTMFLQNQSRLEDFRFDWSRMDCNESPLVGGFPWIIFETPVLNSCETLVAVELTNIAVFIEDSAGAKQFLPFSLSLFSSCRRLEHLTLINYEACSEEQENSATIPELSQGVLINGMDLPTSLLMLRIEGLPTKTQVIEAILEKCWQLESVTFKGLGKDQDLGVTAHIVRNMVKLFYLKNLQLNNFNVSTPEKEQELQEVFHCLDIPYEGENAWIRLWNGHSMARDVLKRINSKESSASSTTSSSKSFASHQ